MFDHFRFLAPFYDKIIRFYDHGRIVRLLELPCRGRLLDTGGGTGRVSQRLASLVDEAVICDCSHAMLHQVGLHNGLHPVQARAEQLPFAVQRFDRILVVDSLHHFRLQQPALEDLVRVLKPGGLLVIEEPDITRPLIKLIAWTEKALLMGSRFLRSDQIVKRLDLLGMKTAIENDGRYIFWVQGRKPLR